MFYRVLYEFLQGFFNESYTGSGGASKELYRDENESIGNL